MKSIEAILDQLTRLGVAIRKSGTSSRLQRADRTFNPENHEGLQNYLALILLAKPSDFEDRRRKLLEINAEEKPVYFDVDITQLSMIQKRLINANLRRRNRFIYAQRHASKLAPIQVSFTPEVVPDREVVNQSDQEPETGPPESGAQRPSHETKSVSAGREWLKPLLDATGMTDTTASAIGTLVMDSASTPSTVMSRMSSTGSKLTYPRPPKFKGLNSFKCPCCCQTLPATFSERHQWMLVHFVPNLLFPTFLTDPILRKHISQDLCPYTCYLDDCPRPEVLYITRDSWMNHISKGHPSSRYWECFACDTAGKFHSAETFTAHVKEHQSISEVHIPTLLDVCLQKAPQITSCPLCTWAEDQKENLDSKDLLDHVAEHVHSFSLLSLPWAADTDEEGRPDFVHSVKKVKDWPYTYWPTMLDEEGHQPSVDATLSTQEHQPRIDTIFGNKEHEPSVDPTLSIQDNENYFNQNDYFVESSRRSLLAQQEARTLDSNSEWNLSLGSRGDDVIRVLLELANEISMRFVDVPAQFEAISNE